MNILEIQNYIPNGIYFLDNVKTETESESIFFFNKETKYILGSY